MILNYFIDILQPEILTEQGTDLNNGIDELLKLFSKTETDFKSALILTDGENHNALNKQKLSKFKEKKISGSIIAIGTEEGGYIINNNGQKLSDKTGIQVITKINIDFINELKKNSEFSNFTLNNINNTEKILTDIFYNFKNSEEKKMKNNFRNKKLYYFFIELAPALPLTNSILDK